MSLGYSIITELYKEYSRQNIIEILKKGELLGITYYEFVPGEYEIRTLPFSAEEAATYILHNTKDTPWIIGKINDTQITIHFMNFPLGIALMFNNFTYPWIKIFNNTQEIDIVKYTKLMLDFVENYEIIKLVVEKD